MKSYENFAKGNIVLTKEAVEKFKKLGCDISDIKRVEFNKTTNDVDFNKKIKTKVYQTTIDGKEVSNKKANEEE